MIIKDKHPVVIRSSKFKSYNAGFDFKSMHIVYDVLRNKLYKNPIGSISREISSNSRDAHRVVKQTRRPEIEIIRERDNVWYTHGNQIIFRDFGPGLSPDVIENIYMLYGASTKRGSDDLTGGFGLGAKTPFAYTDQFIVHTVCEQIEYIYTIYIDESKEGRADLLFEDFAIDKETGNYMPNMTEIIVPILRVGDIATFEKEVYRATAFWKEEEMPKFIGFDSLGHTFKEKEFAHKLVKVYDYKVYDNGSNFFETSVSAIIDGIYYPVDTALIGILNGELDLSICLPFHNGLLNISASRESLQYDDATVEILKSRITEVLNELGDSYKRSIEEQPNYFAGCNQYKYLKNNDALFKLITQTLTLDYKGKNLQIPKILLSNYEMWTVSRTENTIKFRLEKDEVTDLFTVSRLHKDMYVLTVQDELNGEKFRASRNRTIMKDTDEFVFLKEMDVERFEESCKYGQQYKIEQNASRLLIEKYEIPLKRYVDVPETKLVTARKVKKKGVSMKDKDFKEISVRTYVNGDFERQEVKTIDGWIVDKDKNKLKDYVYTYTQTEKGLSTAFKENCLFVSKLVSCISKKVKLLHLTEAKQKDIYKYISLERFLELNRKTVQELFNKKEYESLLDTAKKVISISIIPDKYKEAIRPVWEKYDKLDYLTYFNAIKDALSMLFPNYRMVASDKPFHAIKEFLNDYPLFDSMSTHRSDYIKLQNVLNDLKEKNAEINNKLQEYITKFGELK